MLKEHGEKAVEAAMQKIGQLFAANIRQNDLAFRYEMTTIALILGETLEKEALMAVEKLRKLLAEVKLSDEILPFSAGLAEAVVKQQFDPVGHRHRGHQPRRHGAGDSRRPGHGQDRLPGAVNRRRREWRNPSAPPLRPMRLKSLTV